MLKVDAASPQLFGGCGHEWKASKMALEWEEERASCLRAWKSTSVN